MSASDLSQRVAELERENAALRRLLAGPPFQMAKRCLSILTILCKSRSPVSPASICKEMRISVGNLRVGVHEINHTLPHGAGVRHLKGLGYVLASQDGDPDVAAYIEALALVA